MDPCDFLEVAVALQASHRECDRRTAVGRSYYAVLIHVRGLIEGAGRPVTTDAGSHACVLHYLRACSGAISELKNAHGTLTSMKSDRERSDYEMKGDVLQAHSDLAVRRARGLIEDLNRVSGARLRGALQSAPAFTFRER